MKISLILALLCATIVQTFADGSVEVAKLSAEENEAEHRSLRGAIDAAVVEAMDNAAAEEAAAGGDHDHRHLMPAAKRPKIIAGNSFFIVNKKYSRSKIAQWGHKGRDVGTWDHTPKTDNLWYFEESSRGSGWYYIKNVKNPRFRLAKWGWNDHKTGVYDGHYSDDQLWKLVPASPGHYYIYNKQYHSARLAKWGYKDSDFGSYHGGKSPDQEWHLVPRFRAKVQRRTVWGLNNRGSNKVTKTITVERGFEKTTGGKFSADFGLESSQKAGLAAGLDKTGGGSGSRRLGDDDEKCMACISAEQSRTAKAGFSAAVSHSRTQRHATKSETVFTAPAGKNFQVYQIDASFSGSPLPEDRFEWFGQYWIEETPAK